MNTSTKEKIDFIKTNGYQLDFGSVFNHAFENYKKIALYAGLMLFVFLILFCILVSGILFSSIDMNLLKEFSENMKPENLIVKMLTPNFLLANLGISVILSSFFGIFTAGLIKMADCAENDQEFHVSTVFMYFKAPYFKELFIATFLISLLSNGISTLFTLANIPFIGTLTSILIWLGTFLYIPLIIFGNLNAIEAIKSSAIIAFKEPLVIIALLIVSYIFCLVGFVGCCIGIFFTIPFIYSMYYAIYSNIIGIENQQELE